MQTGLRRADFPPSVRLLQSYLKGLEKMEEVPEHMSREQGKGLSWEQGKGLSR